MLVFLVYACNVSDSPISPENDNAFLNKDVVKNYIIVLNDNIQTVPDVASDVAKQHTAEIGFIYKNSIKGFSSRMSSNAIQKLKNDPRVKYIEEDKIITLAPPADKGKPGGGTTTQTTPWGITRVGGAGNGVGKTVWIIDSGVDLTNQDLNVDLSRSANFVARGKDSPDDGNGHGTHVAGTIAAIDNNLDVVGVAAGATVVAVRVLDNSGSGSYSGVIAGVDYVAQNGSNGDVANMSLGGPVSLALDDAVKAAAATGVKFVLAAGNESDDANSHSPARANGANIYTISAINSSDVFASFSNYNNPPVDFAAPGVSVLSLKKGGGTITFSGTSMAAPHVAGILLLGNVSTDGFAVNDPDGTPDPIAHR